MPTQAACDRYYSFEATPSPQSVQVCSNTHCSVFGYVTNYADSHYPLFEYHLPGNNYSYYDDKVIQNVNSTAHRQHLLYYNGSTTINTNLDFFMNGTRRHLRIPGSIR